MSQLPQNNEPFDNNPEYAKPHRGNNNGQPNHGAPDNQSPSSQPLPTRQFDPSYPRNIVGPAGTLEEGRKLAQRSLTFGIISVVLTLVTFWVPYSLLGSFILGILGIISARDAERRGAPAKAGRILCWIGVILPIALSVLAAITLLVLVFTLKG